MSLRSHSFTRLSRTSSLRSLACQSSNVFPRSHFRPRILPRPSLGPRPLLTPSRGFYSNSNVSSLDPISSASSNEANGSALKGEQPESLEEVAELVKEFRRRVEEDPRLEYLHEADGGAHVFLVGVSHSNTFFYDLIRTVIHFVRPDKIMVELDPGRGQLLRRQFDPFMSQLERPNLKTFSKWTMLLATLLTINSQRKVFKGWNEKGYGKEMWVAMHEAERLGIPIAFGDQDQMVTLKRYSKELLKEFNTIDLRSESSKAQFKANRELDKLNNSDDEEASKKLRSVLREMPTKSKMLGEERDLVLINSLKSTRAKKIVAVMGIAHLDGVVKWWDKEEERMRELGLSQEIIEKRMKRGR